MYRSTVFLGTYVEFQLFLGGIWEGVWKYFGNILESQENIHGWALVLRFIFSVFPGPDEKDRKKQTSQHI